MPIVISRNQAFDFSGPAVFEEIYPQVAIEEQVLAFRSAILGNDRRLHDPDFADRSRDLNILAARLDRGIDNPQWHYVGDRQSEPLAFKRQLDLKRARQWLHEIAYS